jgi:hypothetical protein
MLFVRSICVLAAGIVAWLFLRVILSTARK